MTGDNSLQPFRRGGLAPRSSGVPTQPGAHLPVHQPGEVQWSDAGASREECWQRLSPAVRSRIDQRIGRMLDWWATDSGGRISAVILGTRALVSVNPTVNGSGQPAYELVTVHLAESSFRSVPVRGPSPEAARQATGTPSFGSAPSIGPGGGYAPGMGPAPGAGYQPGIGAAPGAGYQPGIGAAPGAGHQPGIGPAPGGGHQPGTPARPVSAIGLDEESTRILGLLPARAQQLLQDPFLGSAKPVRGDWYVSYTGNPNSLAGAVIRLWCYLTDERSLTFCSGVGHGYRDGAGARSWEVTCWRASTLPRAEAANR